MPPLIGSVLLDGSETDLAALDLDLEPREVVHHVALVQARRVDVLKRGEGGGGRGLGSRGEIRTSEFNRVWSSASATFYSACTYL